jgi:hypothetical protein
LPTNDKAKPAKHEKPHATFKFICPICDSIRTAERPAEKVYCRHGSVGFLMTRFDVKKQGANNG